MMNAVLCFLKGLIIIISIAVFFLPLELITLQHFSPKKIRNLKVIYHPLYSMKNFVTNKSKLPQDGAQVFPYMG